MPLGSTLTGEQILDRLEALSAEAWAQQFNNLIKNGSFDSWSAGAAAAPDGWTLFGGGATVARQANTVRFGEYSAALTRVGNDCAIYQYAITPIDADTNVYWRGRTVTLGCRVYATVADRVRIGFYDGIINSFSPFHTGVAGWEWLTVTAVVNAAATRLQHGCWVITGNTTAYFDGAILVEGPICPAFAQHPNDQHLKAIDYQSAAPANFDYGLLRMECGKANLPQVNADYVNLTITFGTAFTKILSVSVALEYPMTGFSHQSIKGWWVQSVGNGSFVTAVYVPDEVLVGGDICPIYWKAIGVD